MESEHKTRWKGRGYFGPFGGGSKVRTITGQIFTKQHLQLDKEYRQLPDESAADNFAVEKIAKHVTEII